MVLAENLGEFVAGTSIALSSNAAIIGTNLDISKYGFYEYAEIVTVTPGGGASP